jgi:hypothetical protein
MISGGVSEVDFGCFSAIIPSDSVEMIFADESATTVTTLDLKDIVRELEGLHSKCA